MILKGKYSLKKKSRYEELSKDLKNMLKGLLEPDPSKRLTMPQVRKHPWLNIKPKAKVEIFSEAELAVIRKDFTYKEMVHRSQKGTKASRIGFDNIPGQLHNSRLHHSSVLSTNAQQQPHLTTENHHSLPLFTEHELDEDCGGAGV